jgi:hypothetical protein
MIKFFQLKGFSEDDVNEVDHRGNTPLLLTGKLCHENDDYLKAVNFLFLHGANGKLRDRTGWSLLDEAISNQNTRLLAIVFDNLNLKKKAKWIHTKNQIIKKLKSVPDFNCELHWECESNWIRFLGKIAPNDTYHIWKIGSFLKLDFSLVGFSKLKSKRRRMSIIFRDSSEAVDRFKESDMLLINHDKGTVVNPLEDMDLDEKLTVLTDIINSDAIQSELNITEQEWKECKGFFGGVATENINGYDCKKYKVNVKA